jgi:hypothetical protein
MRWRRFEITVDLRVFHGWFGGRAVWMQRMPTALGRPAMLMTIDGS